MRVSDPDTEPDVRPNATKLTQAEAAEALGRDRAAMHPRFYYIIA
jgi:hypothetical protein